MNNESLLIYPKEAQNLIGVGPTKFYELAQISSFPKPKYLDGKRPMYSRTEIQEWINNL